MNSVRLFDFLFEFNDVQETKKKACLKLATNDRKYFYCLNEHYPFK